MKNILECIPDSEKEALNEKIWRQAMDEGLKGTWDIEELPKAEKIEGHKWVFTIKYKPNGEIRGIKLIDSRIYSKRWS